MESLVEERNIFYAKTSIRIRRIYKIIIKAYQRIFEKILHKTIRQEEALQLIILIINMERQKYLNMIKKEGLRVPIKIFKDKKSDIEIMTISPKTKDMIDQTSEILDHFFLSEDSTQIKKDIQIFYYRRNISEYQRNRYTYEQKVALILNLFEEIIKKIPNDKLNAFLNQYSESLI